MKLSVKSIILLALMLLSAALGAALRPRISLADERAPIDLATMVPLAFGDWREEPNLYAQVVNPQQKSVLDKVYSQTLSRTYVNAQGYRIMLSIAYGKNQSDALALHKPEVCYPAQGFQVMSKQSMVLDLPGGKLPVKRIETSGGAQRYEPVTYWTMIGEVAVIAGTEKKLAEMHYGLRGEIPDGLLFRVSSIDRDSQHAFPLHESFVTDILASMPAPIRKKFSGT